MPSLKKYTVPTILATGLAVFALSACGGSDDSDVSELATFAPVDTPVFIEGSVQPDSELAANVDSISERLAGVNLGDLIKDGIDSSGKTDIDFDADVKPWLGENAAAFLNFDPSLAIDAGPEFGNTGLKGADGEPKMSADPTEKFGLIIESADIDAAQTFIDEQAEKEGGARDGDYEGYSYKVTADDGSTVGIVDDFVVVGSSETEFKAAVDASKGDSLVDSDFYSGVSGKVADGALVNLFLANEPYLDALKEDGFEISGFLNALGLEFEGTGSVTSLVPEENEISIKGYSNLKSDLTSGDPSAVIETFPANTLFATGTGDVGANANKIIDALNKEGIPRMLEPGQIDQFMEEASGQIDIQGIIDSLETVAFFVNGNNERNLGGALVATSSNIDPIESSLRGISSLIGLANDADARPLPGGIAGFRVNVDDLPGRPMVIGVKDDRLVVGVGMKASMIALNGEGQTLADNDAYKAADDSTSEDGLDMFANPAGIAKLIRALGSGQPEAKQIADVVGKFSYMAAGSSEGEGTFEFNLGLQD